MVIYKGKKSIELEYNDGKNDSIIVDYEENVVLPDMILLEFLIKNEQREFRIKVDCMQPFIMGETNNKDGVYTLTVYLGENLSMSYLNKMSNEEGWINGEVAKNLNRCNIFWMNNSNKENFCLYTYKKCNEITATVGFKNQLYANYLKNRFVETLDFILFTHGV